MDTLKKVFTVIKTHKLIAGFVVVFILITIIFFPERKNLLPTPSQQAQLPPVEIGTLTPPTIYPKPGNIPFGNTQNSISLYFDVSIDLASISVTSDPTINFQARTHPDFPKRVILQPATPWITGTTYTITISKEIRSVPINTDESTITEFLGFSDDIIIRYTITTPEQPIYPNRPI